jgi:hypothetical protein
MSHGFQSLFWGILFALVFVTVVFARDNDLRLHPGQQLMMLGFSLIPPATRRCNPC